VFHNSLLGIFGSNVKPNHYRSGFRFGNYNVPVLPDECFSGALLEWFLARDPIDSPYFYGLSADNTFVILRPDCGWCFAPLGYWRLFRHRENIRTRSIRDVVYQVYLSREDLGVYLGRFVRRGSYCGPEGEFVGDYDGWEWDKLDVDPYSSGCFERIWEYLK